MGNLTNIQIGSVIISQIDNFPSALSGAPLWSMIDNEIYHVENFTGDSIPVTAVAETYQPAIMSLSAAGVLRMMEMIGADVSSIRLGDFSVRKGASSSTSVTSEKLREDGLRKLDALGQEINVSKALG